MIQVEDGKHVFFQGEAGVLFFLLRQHEKQVPAGTSEFLLSDSALS